MSGLLASSTWTRQRMKSGAQSQSCGGTVLNSAVEVATGMQRSKVIRLQATPPLGTKENDTHVHGTWENDTPANE